MSDLKNFHNSISLQITMSKLNGMNFVLWEKLVWVYISAKEKLKVITDSQLLIAINLLLLIPRMLKIGNMPIILSWFDCGTSWSHLFLLILYFWIEPGCLEWGSCCILYEDCFLNFQCLWGYAPSLAWRQEFRGVSSSTKGYDWWGESIPSIYYDINF